MGGMNVNIQLTPHFHLTEFLHNKSPEGVTPDIIESLRRLAIALETIRALLGNRRITITSGFRSWKHHLEIYRAIAKQKGVPFDIKKVPRKSYHLYGLAADFMVEGMTSAEARKIIDPYWKGGMEKGTPHVHLDLGPNRRFYP